MLQDLLSRLAKKELGDTYSEEDIGIQNRIWEEPLHAQFLEEGAIDDYIDDKIEKIQLALDQAVHDDRSEKADISEKTLQQPDSIGGILSSPIRSGTKVKTCTLDKRSIFSPYKISGHKFHNSLVVKIS